MGACVRERERECVCERERDGEKKCVCVCRLSVLAHKKHYYEVSHILSKKQREWFMKGKKLQQKDSTC